MKSKFTEIALRKNGWKVENIDGMQLVFAPSLLALDFVAHAFTTRVGGQTPQPYDFFNLGGNIPGDEFRRDAHHNRERLCDALSIKYSDLVVPGQVHSRNVELVNDRSQLPDLKGVDGLVTERSETPLLLHFADCVPVIIVDKQTRVIGIFHAGWRGTAQNIVSHGVERMVKELNADPAHMIGAVGPAIGPCCYPTSDEVAQALSETVKDAAGLVGTNGSQPAPDIKAFNAMQLLESGIQEVDVSDFCTACNPSMFYSHRQSGGTTGRQGALVSLRG